MKQLILGGNVAYASSAKSTDLTTVAEGAIAMFDLATGATLSAAAATGDFSIALGRGTKANAFLIPEVNFKTLSVSKATASDAKTFTAKMTIPEPELLYDYTIIVAKKGVVFNERNKWTFTCRATTANATKVADDLVKQINASSETSGVKATNATGVITITATEAGTDYEVIGADELTGVAPTAVTHGAVAILDAEYVKDLASRCAAGKGFEYLAEDGKEIYPGYPETVPTGKYTMWSLRFAVPRKAAKTRDEVVYQVVHIVVPATATATITAIDKVLGVSAS